MFLNPVSSYPFTFYGNILFVVLTLNLKALQRYLVKLQNFLLTESKIYN